MNDENRKIYSAALVSIDRFVDGELSIEDIRSRLEVTLGLLEREPVSADGDIRDTIADLELIQFGQLESEQRPAAIFRLDSLRDTICTLLDGTP